MAIKYVPVTQENYKQHIDRIKSIGKALVTDENQRISKEKAVQIMQVGLHSLNHPSFMDAGKRVVDNMANPSKPDVIEFDNLSDFIDKICTKIITKKVFDETKPDK